MQNDMCVLERDSVGLCVCVDLLESAAGLRRRSLVRLVVMMDVGAESSGIWERQSVVGGGGRSTYFEAQLRLCVPTAKYQYQEPSSTSRGQHLMSHEYMYGYAHILQ